MIYFTRIGDAVKIGFAKKPEKRVKTLRTGSAKEIVVLGVMEGEWSDEQSLHVKFQKHRIRGEFFVLCDEITAYIEANARPFLRGVKRIGKRRPEAPGRAVELALNPSVYWPFIVFCASTFASMFCLFALDWVRDEYLGVMLNGIALFTLTGWAGIFGIVGRIAWLLTKDWMAERRYQKIVRAHA